MQLTYQSAGPEDVPILYGLCKQLIDTYEETEQIDYEKVLRWVGRKIETQIDAYTVIFADGQKAGYYHFYWNAEKLWELDDLYIFPEFQNQGIGTAILQKCCACGKPVMLYVFQKNQRAAALYQNMGFEIVKEIGKSRYIMKKEGVGCAVSADE